MARKALANNKAAIELTAKHTHAGRDYPPGTVLVLADVGLDSESAQWLVSLKRAKWVQPEPPAEPVAATLTVSEITGEHDAN
jgi:hypothetical protein